MALSSTSGTSLVRGCSRTTVCFLRSNLSRPIVVRPCSAYQQSQASNALQQPVQQQGQVQQHEVQFQEQRHHIDPEDWDMNYWHYQSRWLQPHTIVATGVAFFVASIIFDNETTLKTAVLAAGPVALYWFIFLFLLPRTFKNFAVEYIETHPEVEELALQEEQQQQQQQQQQQHKQQ